MEQKYWEQRIAELQKKENQTINKIKKAYNKVLRELELIIAELYIDMIKEGGASPLSYYNSNRSLIVIQKIRSLLSQLGQEEIVIMTEFLTEVYEEEFKNYSKMIETDSEFNKELLLIALGFNWSGSHYSDRIMKNKSKLAQHLEKAISDSIAREADNKEMYAAIRDKFKAPFAHVETMTRTEAMYIYNQAHLDNYKMANIVQYEYLAEIDSRTTEICKELDGNVYFVSEGRVGYNLPPMHQNCRSTIIPII